MSTNQNSSASAKKPAWFKLLIAFDILMLLVIIAAIIVGKIFEASEDAREEYNEILAIYDEENYIGAAERVKLFFADYGDESENVNVKVTMLSREIETMLATEADNNNSLSACEAYLNYYPRGKYIDEMKKTYSRLCVEIGRSNYESGNYMRALEYFDKAINCGDSNSMYAKEAKNITNVIKNTKATGVKLIGGSNLYDYSGNIYTIQCPVCGYIFSRYAISANDVDHGIYAKNYFPGETNNFDMYARCNKCGTQFSYYLNVMFTLK